MRTKPILKVNKAGVYEIRWSEQNGKRWRSHRKSTGHTDYSEAVSSLFEFLNAGDEGHDADSRTVRQVYDHYLRYHSLPRGNDRTDGFVLRAPLGAFGDWPAKSLTDRDIEFYTRQRMSGKYGNREVKPATVRRELVALQAVLNYGCKKGLVHKDRFAFPKPADGAPRQLWIDEGMQDQIVAAMADAPLDVRLFFRLALTYGVRKGAILDLTFGPQIDFISGTIDFHVPGARVTRKRRPVVPMTANVRGDLELAFREKGRGQHVLNRNVADQYEKFMKKIGYGWVSAHCLKHSAITLMLRSGVSAGDVSRLTNTDLRTIYKVYRHYDREELLAIVSGRGI
jgi:integrase